MKINIVYESKYGNGKQCVDHLQNVIRKQGHDVATFSVRETKPDVLPPADLYVFSAPTQIGKPARKMRKFLKN
jgi:flavodoxin